MKVEHFYCYGSIGEADPLFKAFTGQDDPIISAAKVSEFLSGLSGDTTDIIVHINSRGGNVDEGFAIHDLFKTSGKKITTRVEGQASSIASVILFAGSVRQITENSKIMIHNPWIDPYGIAGLEADEVIEIGNEMKSEENRILDFYVNNTGAEKEILLPMMKEETSFDAAKALELKFVTEILTPAKPKAYAFLNRNRKIQNDNTMSKEIKSLSEKFDEKFNGLLDMLKGKSKPANIKAEGEIKAESFTTAEGATINIDGGLVAGSAVTDEAGAPMASATITLADGTTITTDGAGMILTVETKQPDPNQAAIDAAVAAATKALTDQVETLKAQNEEYAAVQAKMDKKFDLLAKEVTSSFQLKTGGTKLSAQASKKENSAPTKAEIDARKKEIDAAKAAKNN